MPISLSTERCMSLCQERLGLMAPSLQLFMCTRLAFHLWRTAERSTMQSNSPPTSPPHAPTSRKTRRRYIITQDCFIFHPACAFTYIRYNGAFLWGPAALHSALFIYFFGSTQKPRSENPVSHWRPHLSLTVMSEDFTFTKAGLPSDVRRYMRV